MIRRLCFAFLIESGFTPDLPLMCGLSLRGMFQGFGALVVQPGVSFDNAFLEVGDSCYFAHSMFFLVSKPITWLLSFRRTVFSETQANIA